MAFIYTGLSIDKYMFLSGVIAVSALTIAAQPIVLPYIAGNCLKYLITEHP